MSLVTLEELPWGREVIEPMKTSFADLFHMLDAATWDVKQIEEQLQLAQSHWSAANVMSAKETDTPETPLLTEAQNNNEDKFADSYKSFKSKVCHVACWWSATSSRLKLPQIHQHVLVNGAVLCCKRT